MDDVSIRTGYMDQSEIDTCHDDVSIHTGYADQLKRDMCHDDINMLMWQHQRLPRVTHFHHFEVDISTNEKVPCDSLYSHMVACTIRGRLTWKASDVEE